jgi:hypothetical protein
MAKPVFVTEEGQPIQSLAGMLARGLVELLVIHALSLLLLAVLPVALLLLELLLGTLPAVIVPSLCAAGKQEEA